MVRSFKGEIAVHPNDFNLVAERFIIDDQSVSFRLEAKDQDGPYSMEGKATKTPAGSFVSPSLNVCYKQANGEFEASVTFSRVQVDGDTCCISGKWLQDGDEWALEGRLDSFKQE